MGHDIGNKQRGDAERQGPSHVVEGEGESEMGACKARNHAGGRRVKHRGPDRPDGDKGDEDRKRWSDADKRDEDHGQKGASQNKKTGAVAVGQVPHGGLDDERQQPVNPGKQSDLSQGKREFFDEDREKRIDERAVKVAHKVAKGEREDDL